MRSVAEDPHVPRRKRTPVSGSGGSGRRKDANRKAVVVDLTCERSDPPESGDGLAPIERERNARTV